MVAVLGIVVVFFDVASVLPCSRIVMRPRHPENQLLLGHYPSRLTRLRQAITQRLLSNQFMNGLIIPVAGGADFDRRLNDDNPSCIGGFQLGVCFGGRGGRGRPPIPRQVRARRVGENAIGVR